MVGIKGVPRLGEVGGDGDQRLPGVVKGGIEFEFGEAARFGEGKAGALRKVREGGGDSEGGAGHHYRLETIEEGGVESGSDLEGGGAEAGDDPLAATDASQGDLEPDAAPFLISDKGVEIGGDAGDARFDADKIGED